MTLFCAVLKRCPNVSSGTELVMMRNVDFYDA
jgi:hypothetical protein